MKLLGNFLYLVVLDKINNIQNFILNKTNFPAIKFKVVASIHQTSETYNIHGFILTTNEQILNQLINLNSTTFPNSPHFPLSTNNKTTLFNPISIALKLLTLQKYCFKNFLNSSKIPNTDKIRNNNDRHE